MPLFWWGTKNLNFGLLSVNELDGTHTNFNNGRKYEVTLIYIGSSTCGFCNFESVQNAFHEIRSNLIYKIDKYGYKFTAIGISRDFIITEGLVHLNKYGAFDEILIGNGWSNSGLLKYVYGKLPGQAATPQILVTFRKYRHIKTNTNTIYRGIKKEKLLIRKIGVKEITRWANTTKSAYIPTQSLQPF